MRPSGTVHRSEGSSYLCQDYELRITHRCLIEDLGSESEAPFDELADDELIRSFIKSRCEEPEDTEGRLALRSDKVLCGLSPGRSERGATWHDDECAVVWLLACTRQVSFSTTKPLTYFGDLAEEGRLLPTCNDYEALLRDRGRRLSRAARASAVGLLARARESPGREYEAVIAGQIKVAVSVQTKGARREVFLAVDESGLTDEYLVVVWAAFLPYRTASDIESVWRLPNRDLREDELGFRFALE